MLESISSARNTSFCVGLMAIAAETDVKHLPDYQPPSPKALLEAARDFEAVKNQLSPGDRALYIPRDGEPLELNLSVRWNIEDIEAMAVKETVTFPSAPMILAVKKPDYLGDSKWDLRHGKRPISARLEDAAWLLTSLRGSHRTPLWARQ